MELLPGVGPPQHIAHRRQAQSGGQKKRRRNALPADCLVCSFCAARRALTVHGLVVLDTVSSWVENSLYDAGVHHQRKVLQLCCPEDIVVWGLSRSSPLVPPITITAAEVGIRADAGNVLHFKKPGQLPDILRQLEHRGDVPRGVLIRQDLASSIVVDSQYGGSLVSPRSWCLEMGVESPAVVVPMSGNITPTGGSTTKPNAEALDSRRSYKGFVDHSYTPGAIIEAWRLQSMLKSHRTPLAEVITSSTYLLEGEARSDEVRRSLESNIVKVPGREIVRLAGFKLNHLYTMFQWELARVQDSFRCWSADSSPQAGFNYFAVIENRVSWPKGLALQEVLDLSLKNHMEERYCGLTTLGYGAAGFKHKLVSLGHCMALEAGSHANFEALRYSIKTWTSDQGIEASLVDGPNLFSENFASWQAVLTDLREGTLQLTAADTSDKFLLPRALFFPDSLHMVFGCLQEVVEAHPEWKDIGKHYRSLAVFMSSLQLRQRFQAQCLIGTKEVFSALFNSWVPGNKFDWKWQYFERFANNLTKVLPVLIDCFDVNTMLASTGDDDKHISAGIVQDVARALQHEGLLQMTELLYCIARELDRVGTWCEGCWCHQHILEDVSLSMKARLAKYEKESRACPWKGKRTSLIDWKA